MGVSKEELDAMLAEADRKIQLEQVEQNLSPQEFAQQERKKWRWSGSFGRGFWLSASDLAADMNTGILSLLGPDVQDWFAQIGVGRYSHELPRMGITGAAADAAGQALTVAATMGGSLELQGVRQGFNLLQAEVNPSLAGRIGRDLQATIERNPKLFFGSEAAGGAGAGAAMAGAQEAGAPPEAIPFAGLAGGFGLGAIPTLGFNFGRKAMNWSLSHVAPWFDGGETLAATRLQKLAADPMKAAGKAKNAPPGVTPGRATEDRNLMALEARIIEDDPTAAAEFSAALERARVAAQAELRDFSGNLRAPGEWERNVIEKVAAPGTTIKLSDPASMLRQAKKSFGPIYENFKGFPVKPVIETEMGDISLDQAFKMAAMDETILAADSERKVAQKILADEFSRIKPAVDKDPTVDSSKLLFVRQMLRERISDLSASRKRGDHITARILSGAESTLTKMFQQQLPGEAMASLAQIDDQFNTYRIVEQAVIAAGDRQLSPNAVAQAVRSLSPRTGQDLKKAARAGRDVAGVLDDQRAAKLMVQGQPGNVRRQIQSDYFHTIWERSLTKDLTDGDAALVSGERYLQHLIKYKDTAKALGIPQEEYNRAVEVAKTIKMMEAKSPQALKQTLEDGPATMMQLMATLVGAKWGSHISQIGPGGGMGSSLVLAQFGSQRARRWLSTFFRDEASDVLIAATKNKELYAALLTKSTASTREQEKAARVIAAWADPVIEQAFDDEAEGGGR